MRFWQFSAYIQFRDWPRPVLWVWIPRNFLKTSSKPKTADRDEVDNKKKKKVKEGEEGIKFDRYNTFYLVQAEEEPVDSEVLRRRSAPARSRPTRKSGKSSYFPPEAHQCKQETREKKGTKRQRRLSKWFDKIRSWFEEKEPAATGAFGAPPGLTRSRRMSERCESEGTPKTTFIASVLLMHIATKLVKKWAQRVSLRSVGCSWGPPCAPGHRWSSHRVSGKQKNAWDDLLQVFYRCNWPQNQSSTIVEDLLGVLGSAEDLLGELLSILEVAGSRHEELLGKMKKKKVESEGEVHVHGVLGVAEDP